MRKEIGRCLVLFEPLGEFTRHTDFSKRHPIPVGDEDISLRINVKDK